MPTRLLLAPKPSNQAWRIPQAFYGDRNHGCYRVGPESVTEILQKYLQR
jgi:hypothetical protein